AEIAQPVLHRILQLLALQVVRNLKRRGLPDVQHGLARQVLRLDLLTHPAPPSRGTRVRAGAAIARGVPLCERARWPAHRSTAEAQAPGTAPADRSHADDSCFA